MNVNSCFIAGVFLRYRLSGFICNASEACMHAVLLLLMYGASFTEAEVASACKAASCVFMFNQWHVRTVWATHYNVATVYTHHHTGINQCVLHIQS